MKVCNLFSYIAAVVLPMKLTCEASQKAGKGLNESGCLY